MAPSFARTSSGKRVAATAATLHGKNRARNSLANLGFIAHSRGFETGARQLYRPWPSSADFQSAVSQCFQPAGHRSNPARANGPTAADWKSAIQQIGNLRYAVDWPCYTE